MNIQNDRKTSMPSNHLLTEPSSRSSTPRAGPPYSTATVDKAITPTAPDAQTNTLESLLLNQKFRTVALFALFVPPPCIWLSGLNHLPGSLLMLVSLYLLYSSLFYVVGAYLQYLYLHHQPDVKVAVLTWLIFTNVVTAVLATFLFSSCDGWRFALVTSGAVGWTLIVAYILLNIFVRKSVLDAYSDHLAESTSWLTSKFGGGAIRLPAEAEPCLPPPYQPIDKLKMALP
ncbi:hypothetical protein BV25DRAFT_1989199 [Artomyces pyxidatus]|uniref:Uncharacterized protein n=1 Tax=Artomyces pyxidatus TaxID=48021 RepID=A0ACB8TBG2_9AGAM|nr:hypothetical protein BV25DRAFT_1989199 [Artomyces pyxidatus]